MKELDLAVLSEALKRVRYANPTDDLCLENEILNRSRTQLEILIERKQLASFFERLGMLFIDDNKKLERMLIIQFIKTLLPALVFSFRTQLTVAPSRPSKILTPNIKEATLKEMDLVS